MSKKIVITGASGFVGCNLVRAFLAQGNDIHILVRPEFKSWRLTDVIHDISLHTVSLQDQDSLQSTLQQIKPDWIFHTAVHGAYPAQTDVHEMVATNITGTMNLVHAALTVGFESFINTGSSSEYGYKDHAPIETEWIDPNSHYALTKAFATQFCRFTSIKENLPITTLRLYSAYGPYEEPSRLMPTLVRYALEGRLPPLAAPHIARDYVYISDIVDAYQVIATHKNIPRGSVYNVGTGTQTTLKDVIECVSSLLPISEQPTWGSMPNRMWDATTWVANNHALLQLGWTAKHSVSTGLESMIQWYKQHPSVLVLQK